MFHAIYTVVGGFLAFLGIWWLAELPAILARKRRSRGWKSGRSR